MHEDELLDLIAHVEAAASGKAATIIGTKKAIRNLDVTPLGDKAKEDLYNMGYAGKFYGTPVVVAPQRHKVGSTDFVLADDMLTIIAGDDKPIKCVYEGDPIVIMGEPTANGDLTVWREVRHGHRPCWRQRRYWPLRNRLTDRQQTKAGLLASPALCMKGRCYV